MLRCASVLAIVVMIPAVPVAAQVSTGQAVQLIGVPAGPDQATDHDQATDAPKPTGTVRGRVVDAVTGRPIARALVSGHFDRDSIRSARTAADGTFTLTRVPAGHVLLTAAKSGYVAGSYPDSHRSVLAPLSLRAEGQTPEPITIAMFRASAISGRVVDAHGEPIDDVQVQVLSLRTAGSGAVAETIPVSGQRSDDIGGFRVGGLPPDTYLLMAYTADPQQDDGPVVARTFYPGVTSVDQAQRITLKRGESAGPLEFRVLDTTLTKVSGRVVNTAGEPMSSVFVSPMMQTPGYRTNGGYGIGTRSDGTFSLLLEPGDYVLESSARLQEVKAGLFTEQSFRGSLRLSVGREPIDDAVIRAGVGGTARGRLVFEGAATIPAELRGAALDIGFGGGYAYCRTSGKPVVARDGTFVLEGVAGTCRIAARSFEGWWLKAVRHRGVDVTTQAIEFEPGQVVGDIEVVYTDKVGELAFDVIDDRGAAVDSYVAVVFPADPTRWTDRRFVQMHSTTPSLEAGLARRRAFREGLAQSDQGAPSASDARPRLFRGLIAGDYLVVAVADVAHADLLDPAFIGELAKIAVPVSIEAADTRTVTLRRVPPPARSR